MDLKSLGRFVLDMVSYKSRAVKAVGGKEEDLPGGSYGEFLKTVNQRYKSILDEEDDPMMLRVLPGGIAYEIFLDQEIEKLRQNAER